MKILTAAVITLLLGLTSHYVKATQADDTTVTVTAQTAGVTPFIEQLTLTASDSSVIKSIQFSVTPKSDSVTRPLSGTYSRDYLIERGFLQPPSGEITLPVYGLYDDFANSVTLTYNFLDGSFKTDSTTITTSSFSDPCGYKNPTVLQARTDSTSLSYDYFMVKDSCGDFSPAILDTDGALRWVGPGGFSQVPSIFFNNAIFIAQDAVLYRIDLDGTVTMLHDYSDVGVTTFHHNIDRGKVGMILDVNTDAFLESINYEVDEAGNILKSWNLAEIITNAMVAGGDDPSDFVVPTAPEPNDWFHNNGVAYNRADDSLLISSRENFLICLDYETLAIKWIFGDPTKKWHSFPSLAQYAVDAAPNSLPPAGQHAPSLTFANKIMVFDNGFGSLFQMPPGVTRTYASPRQFQVDLDQNLGAEVWNYEMGQTINSPICGSVYEDAPNNYLIDYAFVGGFTSTSPAAQLLGLDASGEKVFYYEYPTIFCNSAYNSTPLHLESTSFPAVGPQALNLSTRGNISGGDHDLIAGFILTGTEPKKIALRVLGPSLGNAGLSGVLTNPRITLYDSSGTMIASNDDWADDPGAADLLANGLAPTDASEAALVQTLDPAAYTAVASSADGNAGVGLMEAYDLSPTSASKMANISTRGRHSLGENALISGFIVGELDRSTVVVRALGPSLASAGLDDLLDDPVLTVYDSNGTQIAKNDNWQDDENATDIEQNGLAPTDPAEAATLLNLSAGAYTAIIAGAAGGTGVALVEVYNL